MDEQQRLQELALADHMGAGEYGATRVLVVQDGSLVRIAFGRTGATGKSHYYAGVLLSADAVKSLQDQLESLALAEMFG